MVQAPARPALVCRGRLHARSLAGEVVIVTGAGGGIGFEAARSMLELGASVAIAEIDAEACEAAATTLGALGVQCDVSDEDAVRRLVETVRARFGRIDMVLNNATFAPAGSSVIETTTADWDRSYAVNLRGPVLLARQCLPAMIERRHGVFVCVSSTGGPFLSPYETQKAAQLALANSLDAELEGTGVIAFTIGPGLVPTRTALAAIERIAPRLGTTVDEFWRANSGAVLSIEAAGAGFAAAVAMAGRYAGQEISSAQALVDAGIAVPEDRPAAPGRDAAATAELCAQVLETLQRQAADWKQRSFFERQWMARDFKQRVGLPVEGCLELLSRIQRAPESGDAATLEKLAKFYRHLGQLAAGYVKDPVQREEQVALVAGWAGEVDRLVGSFGNKSS